MDFILGPKEVHYLCLWMQHSMHEGGCVLERGAHTSAMSAKSWLRRLGMRGLMLGRSSSWKASTRLLSAATASTRTFACMVTTSSFMYTRQEDTVHY